MALWSEPNELSVQDHVYIFMQDVDSYIQGDSHQNLSGYVEIMIICFNL